MEGEQWCQIGGRHRHDLEGAGIFIIVDEGRSRVTRRRSRKMYLDIDKSNALWAKLVRPHSSERSREDGEVDPTYSRGTPILISRVMARRVDKPKSSKLLLGD